MAPRSLALVALVALAVGSARAQEKPLDPAALKKVKAATVYIQVKLQDGRTATGSGFLTDEPGLVVTNAHVLNMLDPDSRKPVKVDVTVNPGTPASKTYPATVLSVDRGSDLGAVRIDPKNLPAPLAMGGAANLNETETVYTFGFPFGENLGKEITVSKSSVSSLRKDRGVLMKVQLQGGLNPGNSGGPVVDAKGNVVGVAVSGVRGTQIGFAIPAEFVGKFLNGRIVGSNVGQAYTEGAKRGIPVAFELIDPLKRIKKVEVEVRAGNPGPPREPATKAPPALPGDGPKTKTTMTYTGTGSATADVPVPALGERQVYWVRPIITDGTGNPVWVMATPIAPTLPLERKAATLAFNPPANTRFAAELTTQGGFRIRDEEGTEHSLGLDFRAVVTQTYGKPAKTGVPVGLAFNRLALDVKMDEKPFDLPPDVRRALGDAALMTAELSMDADGGLGKSKADLSRVPRTSQAVLEDLSDQSLTALDLMCVPLPGKKVNATEKWKARRNIWVGTAIIAVPAQADLVYEFLGVRALGGKEYALIETTGTIRGRRGDGLDVGGTVHGLALVALDTGEVIQAKIGLKADVDVTFGRKSSKAIGTLDVRIRPPAPAK
jgi:hypothetical protein